MSSNSINKRSTDKIILHRNNINSNSNSNSNTNRGGKKNKKRVMWRL